MTNQKIIRKAVKKTIKDYRPVLEYFDKYDKGEAAEPRAVAISGTVSEFVQNRLGRNK